MAKMRKGRGGSQPPKAPTINRRSPPKSGKPARVHPLNKGFPKSFRKGSAPLTATNPNAQTRQRLDKFSSIAHAHTAVAAPIKAYPINDRSKAKVTKPVDGDDIRR
jgi:hypothetical protein